jgi:xylan 1,4-beta-xylosidase
VNFEGALTWAFEFEGQPYFAGFRALATNGIDLPVLNVFRMFAKMSGQRLAVESDSEVSLEKILQEGVRTQPDVSALASLTRNKLSVLLWHYHDDDVPGPAADIALVMDELPLGVGAARLSQFRIDNEHSNAFAAWQRMGSPPKPTPEQYARLEKAGQLAVVGVPVILPIKGGKIMVHVKLPRQGVSLLVFEWMEQSKKIN